MYEPDEIFELIFKNLKGFIFPEKLLMVDLEMSKMELLSLITIDRYSEIIMSQMADYINTPMSTATGIIDRLVRKGYIVRDRAESDRRIVVLKLSEKGKLFTSDLKERIAELIQKAYAVLSEEETQYLFRIIEKIIGVFRSKANTSSAITETTEVLRKIAIE